MTPNQLFRLTILAEAIVFLPIMLYFRLRSQSTREHLDRWQEGAFILFALRICGFAGMLGLLTFLIRPAWMTWSSMLLPIWLRWIGVGLATIGGLLTLWTFATLGKNLTDTVVTRKDHKLIISGPYRFVRHPFYDCVLLVIVGNALAAANWFILIAGLATFLLVLLRTRIEEFNLIARFGDEYRNFMRTTPRFIPRIHRRDQPWGEKNGSK